MNKIETVAYEEGLQARLQDPKYAAQYLKAAAADSPEAFLVALKDVAQVKGMGEVAKKSGLNRQALYRMLSEEGNPVYRSMVQILDTVGLEFTVKPKVKKRAV